MRLNTCKLFSISRLLPAMVVAVTLLLATAAHAAAPGITGAAFDLVAKNKLPKAMLDKLPPAAGYAKAVFPTLEEQNIAKDIITKQWGVVGADVAK